MAYIYRTAINNVSGFNQIDSDLNMTAYFLGVKFVGIFDIKITRQKTFCSYVTSECPMPILRFTNAMLDKR